MLCGRSYFWLLLENNSVIIVPQVSVSFELCESEEY